MLTRTINIVVEFENYFSDLAATNKVTYKPNLSDEFQYSEDQLQWYNDLIDTIFDLIEDYARFRIVESYQSSESYSYYIEFEAFTREGHSLGNFTIRFRICDHPEKSKRKQNNNNGSTQSQIQSRRRKIFRSIKVNEVSQSGIVEAANTVQAICDGLLDGDVSVLDDLGR